MKRKSVSGTAFRTALIAACALFAGCGEKAVETIRVGMILPMSGPFAEYGKQMETGARLYMQLHGDVVDGHRIELVVKDNHGPAPEVARRLAQEMVVRDKVQFLAGFGFTPDAFAAAPVATQAGVPMIVMNAASSMVTEQSPYIARVSFTLPQVTAPLAQWAARNGIRRVFTLVSDYAPGLDAEAAFREAFTVAGGQIAGELRVPLNNPEFAPFLQRIKDAAPQAVFIFVPSGEPAIAFIKGFAERGLADADIRLIGTGDVTDDSFIQAVGDAALGVVTTHHYSVAHDSTINRRFVQAYADAYGTRTRPNQMAVSAYDGMAAIYQVVQRLDGDIDGDRAMEVLKGLRIDSPRGPVSIDPVTRDIVQTVYVRRVEKRDGELYNIEFDRFENVRDPGKR
ncbi:MAG TPA: ABC transporter substrate-binding protein [Burkholderiales bacterium]|nr:ABC transporter substrate-binding protein [Burkholderiales bacterium]